MMRWGFINLAAIFFLLGIQSACKPSVTADNQQVKRKSATTPTATTPTASTPTATMTTATGKSGQGSSVTLADKLEENDLNTKTDNEQSQLNDKTEVATPVQSSDSPAQSLTTPKLPLSTKGRYIVDSSGVRVRLAGVNWYGASDIFHVVGGLDKQTPATIAKIIKGMGFNVVRLPFSNQMLTMKTVDPKALTANPTFNDYSALQVFDEVVKALSAQGLMIILNNHTTTGHWCCGNDEDALWYNKNQTTEKWMLDWEAMVNRYKGNPFVIGADLRNEIRQGTEGGPAWNNGEANDFKAASTALGNRLIKINSNLLIVVEGLNYAVDLTGVRQAPVVLDVPNHLVYSPHNYGFFGFADSSYEQLKTRLDIAWGYIVQGGKGYTAPIWVSEFGVGPEKDGKERPWFENFIRYLKERDYDWCYWPLNVGPQSTGNAEIWGLVTADWSRSLNDWRVALLQSVQKPTTPVNMDELELVPYAMKPLASGLYLDISGGSTKPDGEVIQWEWNGGNNQRFIFVPDGGYYRIMNANSTLYLDIAAVNDKGVRPVLQQLKKDVDTQLFKRITAGNNTYRFESKSGLGLLTISGTDKGAVAIVKPATNANDQAFLAEIK